MKADASSTCWLCERELGRRVQLHHTVPKSKGGRETVPLHPICHRTIHRIFTNAELSRFGADREALFERPELTTFVNWVRKRPADFDARVR